MYILLFFNDNVKKVIHESSGSLFNRNLMNLVLERYDDDIYKFDDISSIILNDYSERTIRDIPNKLKSLKINDSALEVLPDFPLSISNICINSSHMFIYTSFEKYTNLVELRLKVAHIAEEVRYPESLVFKAISISIPIPVDDPFAPARERAHPSVVRDRNVFVRKFRPVLSRVDPAIKNLVENGQSVHISSINESVSRSIAVITECAAAFPLRQNPVEDMKAFLAEKYKTEPNILSETPIEPQNTGIFSYIFSFLYRNPPKVAGIQEEIREAAPEEECEYAPLLKEINVWMANMSVHSMNNETFGTLFEKIVRVGVNHESKNDILSRLETELTDSIGMCFTGQVNRMVNSLVGFIEGVVVSFSLKEQILLESNMIMASLTEKKISFDAAMARMEGIFAGDEVKDLPDFVDTRDAYILALEDYRPEPLAELEEL